MDIKPQLENKIIKINYKKLYNNEKEKRENVEKNLKDKNKEIEKLKKNIDEKNKEMKEVKKKLLSYTNSDAAKDGYKEENLICDDLNKNNELRPLVEKFLGNDYDHCSRVNGNCKCDIQSANKFIKAQVKKYKNRQFQQLDRHYVDNLIKHVPELENISLILKDLCEYPLLSNGILIDKDKSIKKLCLSNYSESVLENFIDNLNKHKNKILDYAFFGTNLDTQPKYLFAVEYVDNKRSKIVLCKIKDIMEYLDNCCFKITKRKTVITLGDDSIISLQRKGGDGGKKSSNQLQIKITLSKLLDKVEHIQHIL